MKWFKQKIRAKALVDSNGKVHLEQVDEKQWRLQMFKRRGYVLDKYSVKEGK